MQLQSRHIRLIYYVIITALVVITIFFILPKLFVLFLPFIIGWVIATIVNPFITFAEKKLKIPRKIGSAIFIFLTVCLIGSLLYLIIIRLIIEGQSLINNLPNIIEGIKQEADKYVIKINNLLNFIPDDFKNIVDETINNLQDKGLDFVKSLGLPTLQFAGTLVLGLPKMIILIIITLLSSYFISADKKMLSELVAKMVPSFVTDKLSIVKNSLKSAIGGYVKAQVIILFFIFVIVFTGFSLLRIKYSFLLALLISIFDAFPFFGTGAFLIPAAIYNLFTHNIKSGLGFLAIYGCVIITRQLIEPKIVGDNIGLHPLATLMSMYAGMKLMGILGLILGPLILIIMKNLHESGLFDGLIESFKDFIKDMRKIL